MDVKKRDLKYLAILAGLLHVLPLVGVDVLSLVEGLHPLAAPAVQFVAGVGAVLLGLRK